MEPTKVTKGGGDYQEKKNKKRPRMEGDTPGGGAGADDDDIDDYDESKFNQIGEKQNNPMMIDVILKNLFGLVSFEDLSRYRQVCKHWYNLSLPNWLKNGSTIVIKSDKENDAFLKFLEEVHLQQQPSENRQEDIIAGIKKYRKFHLTHASRVYPAPHFEVFWKLCGAHLTHLTLQNFKIPDPVTFKNIMFCKSTPNLEYLVVDIHSVEGQVVPQLLNFDIPREKHENLRTLKIDVVVDSEVESGSGHFIPLDWKALFNNYPKLEHFGVGRCLSINDSVRDDILLAITELSREDNEGMALKSMMWFYDQCNFCNWHGLESPPLPPLERLVPLNLEELSIALDGEEPAKNVKGMLSIYAATLKKLVFYREEPFDTKEGSPFPDMAQLDTLEITGWSVDDLSLLEKLPNLRALRLWRDLYFADSAPETLFSATTKRQTFPSVSEFCCNYQIDWVAADIKRLLSLMPNLTHLGMNLSNQNFPMVCRYLPQLQHLEVYGEELGDDGILGLKKKKKQKRFNQPNISKLKELKSFSIKWADKLSDNFTKDSVVHGLVKLPLLNKLVIEVTHSQVDPEVRHAIAEEIPFAKVIFTEMICPQCDCKLPKQTWGVNWGR